MYSWRGALPPAWGGGRARRLLAPLKVLPLLCGGRALPGPLSGRVAVLTQPRDLRGARQAAETPCPGVQRLQGACRIYNAHRNVLTQISLLFFFFFFLFIILPCLRNSAKPRGTT